MSVECEMFKKTVRVLIIPVACAFKMAARRFILKYQRRYTTGELVWIFLETNGQ